MGRLNPNFTRFAIPVKFLSGGQRQAVAIARAVHFNARILIMDEPTAALGPAETAQVRNVIRQLKGEGIGIFLVSHDIHDVFELSDRISVMYHGGLVGTVNKDEVTTDEVLGMIILGKPPRSSPQKDVEALHLGRSAAAARRQARGRTAPARDTARDTPRAPRDSAPRPTPAPRPAWPARARRRPPRRTGTTPPPRSRAARRRTPRPRSC